MSLEPSQTSPAGASVLVVEDEPVTRALISACLERAGLRVTALADARSLTARTSLADVDLVMLDIELPDGDGFALAQWVRARSQAGLIFLSRRGAPTDRVRGLDLGGDDYVVKPPDLDELIARVRAVLRRRRPGAARTRFGGWCFDPQRFELCSPSGEVAPLTAGEAGVLSLLVTAHGRVVARDALRRALGEDASDSARSLDVLVHRLRRKLGEGGNIVPRILLTVHGVGYRLGVAVEAER